MVGGELAFMPWGRLMQAGKSGIPGLPGRLVHLAVKWWEAGQNAKAAHPAS
jgi:hypothetical protein